MFLSGRYVFRRKILSIHFGQTYTVDINTIVYFNVLVMGAGSVKCTLSEVESTLLEHTPPKPSHRDYIENTN